MNAPEPHPAFDRPLPSWSCAWGGIWRLTAGRWLNLRHAANLVGMIALLVLIAYVSSRWNRPFTEARYAGWICSFYLGFVMPILVLISGGGAIRDDMKPGTADYLFTRPVRRPVYVSFKYLAHMACTQADYLLALAVLTGFGVLRGAPGMISAAPLLLLAQVGGIAAYEALGILFGVLTSRYVIVGLGYIAIVEFGIGNIRTQINQMAIARQVRSLAPVYSIQTGARTCDWQAAVSAAGILAAACVLLIAIAGTIFSFREMAGGQAREDGL